MATLKRRLVRCEDRDNISCPAGRKDRSWLVGHVYCDHYDWHQYDKTVCDLPCKVIEGKPKLKRRK